MTMSTVRLPLLLAFCAFCLCLGAQTKEGETVRGNASYYSDKLQGRRMANGEKYERDSFTCAHLRYPLGTLVRVRNPRNGRECVVKVTDRGPHSRKLTIDLSRAAAEHLDIIAAGYEPVEITPIYSWPTPYEKPEPGPVDTLDLHLEYAPKATYPLPAWLNKVRQGGGAEAKAKAFP